MAVHLHVAMLLQSRLVAVLMPDEEAFMKWANKKFGEGMRFEELCSDPRVVKVAVADNAASPSLFFAISLPPVSQPSCSHRRPLFCSRKIQLSICDATACTCPLTLTMRTPARRQTYMWRLSPSRMRAWAFSQARSVMRLMC